MSALNTSSSHLPTKFSQPPNLHICITSSQFSLLAALSDSFWIYRRYINKSIYLSRSSSLVTLARPSTSSSLRITDRSFQYASPRLWNQLPAPLRQPCTNLSNSASPSSLSGIHSISSINSPFSSSITPSFFHTRLKTFFSANPSHRSLTFLLPHWLHRFPGLFTDTSEHIRCTL